MNVLFFSHSSGLGGAERSLLALIDELLSFHVSCFVVIPHEGSLATELRQRELPVAIVDYAWWCDTQTLPPAERKQRNWNSLRNLANARKELESWQPDVVLTNSITIPWGAIFSNFSSKPHVLFVREFGEKDFQFQFFSGYEPSIQFLSDSSQAILTNSQATRKHFKDLLKNTAIEHVYPSVKIETENLSLQPAFSRAESLKLVVSGGVTESKGQFDAVQATKILVEQSIDAELLLVGSLTDSEYVQMIQSYIKQHKLTNNVRLLGFTSQPLSYVAQTDIALVCSKNEAFGRATLEAMALKKLVIGTNSGGTKELIKDGETGYLYESGNAQELAEKILFASKHTTEAKTLVKNAFQRYKDVQKQGQYGKKVYNTLVKARLMELTMPQKSKVNTFSFLGLFGTLIGDGWDGLNRSLAMSKIQLALHPEALSQRLQRGLSEIT